MHKGFTVILTPILLGVISVSLIYRVADRVGVFDDQERLDKVYSRDASISRGLLPLFRDGDIRPATEDEIKTWQQGYMRNRITQLPPYVLSNTLHETKFDLRTNGVFVIEGDEVSLPDDMFGDKRRAFIVPAGKPVPSYTDLADAQIYRMDSFNCMGSTGLCKFEQRLQREQRRLAREQAISNERRERMRQQEAALAETQNSVPASNNAAIAGSNSLSGTAAVTPADVGGNPAGTGLVVPEASDVTQTSVDVPAAGASSITGTVTP